MTPPPGSAPLPVERLVDGLIELAESLAQESPGPKPFETLCETTRKLLACDRASIFLLERGYYRARYNAGNPPDVALVFPRFRVRSDDPLISLAHETGLPVTLNDAPGSALMNQETAGSARIAAIIVAPLSDPEGEPTGFVTAEFNETPGEFSPLHARLMEGVGKLAELLRRGDLALENRERLESRVASAERLEAIGRLAAGVAHDFNNLLTAISGYAGLVEAELPPAARPLAGEILAAAERGGSLTSQLLALGQRLVPEPRDVDVSALIERMEPLLQRLLPETIRIERRSETAPCLVNVDPGQLEQVIMNLVLNGRDAMPKGGRLLLEVERLELSDPSPAWPDLAAGPYIQLAVSDDGAGIPLELQNRIFEPFFSTRPGHGSGLGLATVHGIVRQSGGDVAVESDATHGSRFRVLLPRSAAAVESAETVPAPIGRTTGHERVLVVEDEPAVRSIFVRGLVSQGYEVVAAAGAEEALDELRRNSRGFSVLVTDLVMPGMSGRELAERSALIDPALRVLYVSGYPEDALRGGTPEEGARLLSKPFTVQTLAAAVRSLLDEENG